MKMKHLIFITFFSIVICIASIITNNKTTSAEFSNAGNSTINISCGQFLDYFTVEIYDGDTQIEDNDIQLDKDYTIKVYNKSEYNCDFYFTLSESVINTFSGNLEIIISQDISENKTLANTSSVRSGDLIMDKTNSISVTSFDPSDEPLIYNFRLSTSYLEDVINYDKSLITDFRFNLVLSFIASTTTK